MTDNKDIIYKMVFIFIIIVFMGVGVIVRIVHLQTIPRQTWDSLMQTVHKEKLKPFRGDICACDGSILATSMPSYTVHWDLTVSGLTDTAFNNNVDSLAKCVSNLFEDYSPEEYAKRFKNARKEQKKYFEVHKRVSYTELNILKKFPLFKGSRYKTGLITRQEYNREQITDLLSRRTIGTYNEEGKSTGLEAAFNDELSGKEGYLVLRKISSGEMARTESSDEENTSEPEDGYDIITTLDFNIQDFAERALEKQLLKYNAGYGSVIIMEVKTGKIRALCNLEKNANGKYSEQINRAVATRIEPGSTFKLASMIAILETGVYDINDTIDTKNGIFKIGKDASIKDDHEGGFGKITVRQVFEKSSNVGFAIMTNNTFGNKKEEFIDRLYNMHLDKETGIEIQGEPLPHIKYPGDKKWWFGSHIYTSIGYELEITPLQLLTLYNAVANDGVMLKPHLLERVSSHGKIIKRSEPEIINSSICSEATLKKVQDLLIGVVNNGTAKQIFTPKYQIAGKTGTAQIAKGNSGYVKEDGTYDYTASFVGYFPADKPKYSCIVVISNPKEHSYYGSTVSAPVFKAIADKLYTTDYDLQHKKEFDLLKYGNNKNAPISKNGDRIILDRILSRLRIELENVEDSETPLVSTTQSKDKIRIDPLPSPKGIVPNVVGMGLRDAMYELKNKKLDVTVIGRGTVKKQSITPGSKIPQNNKIIIELGS